MGTSIAICDSCIHRVRLLKTPFWVLLLLAWLLLLLLELVQLVLLIHLLLLLLLKGLLLLERQLLRLLQWQLTTLHSALAGLQEGRSWHGAVLCAA
jgi:hypothetical protein